MDIFPDWLGETGGAGTPYPVIIDELVFAPADAELTLEMVGCELILNLACAEWTEGAYAGAEQNWDEIDENWDEIDWNWDGS